MKHLLIIAAAFFAAGSAVAQKGNIKGVVADKSDPLPGVSVSVEGKAGTLTDLDGSFQLIAVDTGTQTLRLTYLGYATLEKTIHVQNNETVDLGSIDLAPSNSVINEILITGNYRQGGQAKAINMTKMSDKSVTVLSSESIGKSPVKGTAFVIRQAPGVSVKDDKVSLRGTPVDWTSSLLNGDRMPTADEKDASRVFNFEVFPSSLIDYIVVNRTVTPDLEGDNIGGVIDFMTKAPVTEKTLNFDLSTGYDAISRKPLASGSFALGNTSKNKKLSYILNGSYGADNYGKDAPSVAYGTNYNHSLARLQLDRVRGLRQTGGLNAAVDYQVNENFKLGANILGGYMSEDGRGDRMSYNWSDGSGARIRLQNSRAIYNHELYGGALNASWKLSDKFKVEARIASYYNQFSYGHTPQADEGGPNGDYTVEFVSPLLKYTDMIQTNFFGGAYDPNNSKDPNPYPYKMLDIDNPYHDGGDHYNNIQPKYENLNGSTSNLTASDYYLSSVFADLNTTWERDPIVGRFDISYKANNKLKFKAGFKYRDKNGSRNVSFFEYQINPMSPFMYLSDQQTTSYDPQNNYLSEWGTPYKGTFLPVLTNGQLNSFVKDNIGNLKAKPMDIDNNNFRQWIGSNYTYTEQTIAGYIMSEWKPSEKFSLTGGVRLEHTILDETSDTMVDDNNTKIGVNEKAVSIHKSYMAILPSLNALFTPGENSNIRASISRTFHRPNFEQTKPGSALFNRDQYMYIFGNSGLKPTYSLNFDLSFEHYWGTKGMFSLGAYYKDVTDHIFRTNQIDGSQSIDGFVVKGYENAANSYVTGFEALIDRKFDFLPGFWKGFGVSANVTLSYSRMNVPGRTKSQPLTEQTPLMYNAALFYEKGKVSTRMTLNYTGAYSTELNLFSDINTNTVVHDNTDYDVFMGAMYSLDYQFAYAVSRRVNVYGTVNNILNAPYRTYIGVSDRPLLTEYYRQRVYVGVKFHL
jgi:TonB-dependent receptor